MERDFLGLGHKTSARVTVKEEYVNGSVDYSATTRGSTMQWSFSNKVSAPSQLLSFKGSQEDWPKKTVHGSLDANKTGAQKDMVHDKQNSKPAYSLQHVNAHSVGCPQEIRMFPASNQPVQTIMFPMNAPLQSHPSPIRQNASCSTITPQIIGGLPIASPITVPPIKSPVIGSTDSRNATRMPGAPSQLTIFYAGSVCVYNDISPEKAQAIMLLAGGGNSSPVTPIQSLPMIQEAPKRPVVEVSSSKTGPSLPFSIMPSPGCVNFEAGSSSVVKTSCSSDILAVKPAGTSEPLITLSEPPKVIGSVGPAAATIFPSVAIPQARKASLARFLEKRKERVMNASPYAACKISLDSGSDNFSPSTTSSASCANLSLKS